PHRYDATAKTRLPPYRRKAFRRAKRVHTPSTKKAPSALSTCSIAATRSLKLMRPVMGREALGTGGAVAVAFSPVVATASITAEPSGRGDGGYAGWSAHTDREVGAGECGHTRRSESVRRRNCRSKGSLLAAQWRPLEFEGVVQRAPAMSQEGAYFVAGEPRE